MTKQKTVRVAGVPSAGTRGIELTSDGRPVLPSEQVEPEDCGEGQLTGHSIARDVMLFARDRPGDDARQLVEDTIKSSVLAALHSPNVGGFEHRGWAGSAFLHDIVGYLLYAAKTADIDERFARMAADAQRVVDNMAHFKEEKLKEDKTAQRCARRVAKAAIARVMRSS